MQLPLALLILLAAASPATNITCQQHVCVQTTPEYRNVTAQWVARVSPNGLHDNIALALLNCGLEGEPISLFEVVMLLGNQTPTVFNATSRWYNPGQSMLVYNPTMEEVGNTQMVVVAYVKYQEIRHLLQDLEAQRVHANEIAFNGTLNSTGK